MNKLYLNKYFPISFFSIFSISIFYSYNDIKIWKLIKKYDKLNLFESIWKIKFNNFMNVQIINFIEDAIKSNNYNNKYLKLRYEDIYQSGWKPNYKVLEDISKNNINSKRKFIVNYNKDNFSYYNRVILKFNEFANEFAKSVA